MFWVVGRRYQFVPPHATPVPLRVSGLRPPFVPSSLSDFFFLPPSSLQGLNLCLLFAADQFEPVFREALFVSHGMLRRGSCGIVMMSCWMRKTFSQLFELETLDHLHCLFVPFKFSISHPLIILCLEASTAFFHFKNSASN